MQCHSSLEHASRPAPLIARTASRSAPAARYGNQAALRLLRGGFPAPPSVREVLRSAGAPLDAATRAYFEPRFARALSNVRVHTGAPAARSAAAIGAEAYTAGGHIVLGASAPSRQLMAHELAHVVQQQASPISPESLAVGSADSQLERQADGAARQVTGGQAPPALASSSPAVQRTVVVDPGGKAGEVAGWFNDICSGTFSALTNQITGACNMSSVGCDSLCDVVADPNRTYTIHVQDAKKGTQKQTLFDGTTATVPTTTSFPNTNPGTNPDIFMPSNASDVEFGGFNPKGRGVWAPTWRILGHELCGHGRLNQTYTGPTGNRPKHDDTIDTENAIAAEHNQPARGHYADPRQGESFFNPKGDRSKVVFYLKQGSGSAKHYEAP